MFPARELSMRSRPLTCVAVPLAAALLTCAACSVERHYRTLSFFFDGVPDPHAPVAEPVLAPAQDTPLVASPELVVADSSSLHPPVRERQCHLCHALPERASGSGWQAGVPELLAPRAELCQRCHEPPAATHVHGPAGARRCDVCHEAHQSRFPHLLRQERQETLCRACHQDGLFLTSARHAAFGARDCIVCHDPHGTETATLLRAGWEHEVAEAEAGR